MIYISLLSTRSTSHNGHRVKYGLDHWTLGPLDYFLDHFFGLFHGLNFGLFLESLVRGGYLVLSGGGLSFVLPQEGVGTR